MQANTEKERLINQLKEILYDAVDGIHEGLCKNLTVLKLEEALEFLGKLEDEVTKSD
jgi:hypothetical protein